MDTGILSKDILEKLGDISKAKVQMTDGTDEILCEYVEDKKAVIKFFNGTLYEGPIIGGQLHGNGLLTYSDGTSFKGNFVNNSVEGIGEVQYSELEGYEGVFKGFQRHGLGKYWHRGLDIDYYGEWKNDKIEGKGKLEVVGKWVYEGNFISNKKTGKGLLKFESGNIYDGTFVGDKKDGFGKMQWVNPRESYQGGWIENQIQGFGVYVYQDSFSVNKSLRNFYKGFFQNGKRDGLGVHFYSDGSVYFGEWKRNMKHGKAVYVDAFGERFQMKFLENRRVEEAPMNVMRKEERTLGFILNLVSKELKKSEKIQYTNFILNNKKTYKALFDYCFKMNRVESDECLMVTVGGVLKLLKKLKLINRKANHQTLHWLVKNSEHNFIFLNYKEDNMEVRPTEFS